MENDFSLSEKFHPGATLDANATRKVEEVKDDFRGPFARDRDRILYSRAFRRLAHKTQVYLTSASNDHLRMRLTHTLEVTNLSRTIARNLGLNESLTEAIGLGHDVGHTPFGHAGESQLDAFLNGKMELPGVIIRRFQKPPSSVGEPSIRTCDFRHNFQSVRLLDSIEDYSPKGTGLNLTIQCLEGILKHTSLKSRSRTNDFASYPDSIIAEFIKEPSACSPEGQTVAVADEIAQVSHDIGDALFRGVINLEDIFQQRSMVKIIESSSSSRREFLNCAYKDRNIQQNKLAAIAGQVISAIITFFVERTIEHGRLSLENIRSSQECRLAKIWPNWHPVPQSEFDELRQWKDDIVVNSFSVNRMDNKGKFLIRQLLDAYICDPRQLPDSALVRYARVFTDRIKINDMLDYAAKKFGLEPIAHQDLEHLLEYIKCTAQDKAVLRRIRPRVLDMLTGYLAVDLDYRRTIVDHIALMTDQFAEEEVRRLYGAGRIGI